jgi:predicted Fe-Mo cluster-binding NifX family protein
MKICITSLGKDLESDIDPRFGRCAFFIIVDPDTMEFESLENANARSGGGAGIQSGQLVNEKGVKAVITGNVGPNAFQTLKAAGIDIITGASGKVSDAVYGYKNGKFKPVNSASVESHFGMKGNN